MKRLLWILALVTLILELCLHAAHADQAGERRYNFTTKKYEFYDGSNWYNFNLGIALGVCSSEGAWDFDTLLSAYEYCDGDNWIKIVGTPTLSGCSPAAKMDYFSNSYYYCNGLVWMNMKGLLVL